MVEYIGGPVISERCCLSGKVVEYIGGRVIRKGAAFRKGGRVIRKGAAF